jgi:hypothetical protein
MSGNRTFDFNNGNSEEQSLDMAALSANISFDVVTVAFVALHAANNASL